MNIAHSHVVLDACCILNFCASGHLLEILQSIPTQFSVTQIVLDEELKTLQPLEHQVNETVMQFQTAIAQGLLSIVDFESEDEAELFVNYATVLDDGESATLAIAVHRGWAIATDDKKAISLIKQQRLPLQILSTSQIIKQWSEEADLDGSVLCEALNAIQVNGRYFPQKTDPLRNWWKAASTDIVRHNI